MDMTGNYTGGAIPAIGKLEIESPKTSSTDQMNMMNNPLLWLITMGFLRGNGGFLGGNDAAAAAAAGGIGIKDMIFQAQQGNTAAINDLAKQCCCSTQQILQAVSSITPDMLQGFANQNTAINAGFSTAQLQNFQSQSAILNAVNTGFAATALADCNNSHALSKQISDCCCANQLASKETQNMILSNSSALSNQLNLQTCAIEKMVLTDGAATRALINDLRVSDLQQQLADAKQSLTQCNAIGATSQIVGGAVEKLTALISSCPCDKKA